MDDSSAQIIAQFITDHASYLDKPTKEMIGIRLKNDLQELQETNEELYNRIIFEESNNGIVSTHINLNNLYLHNCNLFESIYVIIKNYINKLYNQ